MPYAHPLPQVVSRVAWWAIRLSPGNLTAAPLLLQILQVGLSAQSRHMSSCGMAYSPPYPISTRLKFAATAMAA